MRLALVSASGTPTATNLSFWRLGALGTSKIGFLGQVINFDGANVSELRKYDLLTFCGIISGGPTGGPTGGLRFQVSALRSQVSGIHIYIFFYIHILYKYITYLALKTMIVQNW